ncbi:hypothetical protein DFH06DRAFT_72820 [Mycena polygramma]|nr:hypothetical protein DFH06DRAFT_72820 [Mycena polygramma]
MPNRPRSDSSLGDFGPVSGIFSGAHHFHVAGGTFINTTNYIGTQTVPTDFRTIPLGDLDLRRIIGLEGLSAVARSPPGRASVRRMYSARIHGFKANMTAVLYQGDRAEERWRADIVLYSGLRHSNLVQLYGIVNSASLYATVFHDDLMPYAALLEKYHHSSHLATVFLWASAHETFWVKSSEHEASLAAHPTFRCSRSRSI